MPSRQYHLVTLAAQVVLDNLRWCTSRLDLCFVRLTNDSMRQSYASGSQVLHSYNTKKLEFALAWRFGRPELDMKGFAGKPRIGSCELGVVA